MVGSMRSPDSIEDSVRKPKCVFHSSYILSQVRTHGSRFEVRMWDGVPVTLQSKVERRHLGATPFHFEGKESVGWTNIQDLPACEISVSQVVAHGVAMIP